MGTVHSAAVIHSVAAELPMGTVHSTTPELPMGTVHSAAVIHSAAAELPMGTVHSTTSTDRCFSTR